MNHPAFGKIPSLRMSTVALSVVLVLVFGGCGKQSSEPSQADIRAAIAKALPPVLTLDQLEYDVIGTSPESLTIKFKAEAKARENLCRPIQNLLNDAMLLEIVYAANESVVLYGSTGAQKQVDRWNFGPVQFDRGFDNLGIPQSHFTPSSVVQGTLEAKRAIEAHDAFVAQKAREHEEMLAREEERIRNERAAAKAAKEAKEARLAKEKAEKTAAVAKALAPGTSFRGTLSSRDIQNVELVVKSFEKMHLTAELINLDQSGVIRTFAGEVTPHASEIGEYSMVLTPIDSKSYDSRDVWIVFRSNGEIKLHSTSFGLEGKANFRGYIFKFRLNRR